MSLEPKHKNFKDEYKIKERVKENFIPGATDLYYCSGFLIILLSGTSKLVTQPLKTSKNIHKFAGGVRKAICSSHQL
jgi:hypothetical protein